MDREREGWFYRNQARIALAGLLIAAAAFRLYGLNWDDNHHLHPDERAIVFAVGRVSLPPAADWPNFFNPLRAGETGNFFNATSPLNPGFFAYGSWPVYLVRATAYLLTQLAPLASAWPPLAETLARMQDFDYLTFLGRILSAGFDLGTILATYFLGKRILHRGAGILAAGMVAFTVLNIQYSHFFAVDIPLTFLVTLALYFATCYLKYGGRRWAVALGVAMGLTLATKFAAAPLLLVLPLAYFFRLRELREPVRNLVTMSIATLIAFFLAQPYAILDWPTYLRQILEQGGMVSGELDFPYTRQYAETTPYIYHIVQSTLWAMGLPFGLVAWGGLVYVLRRNILQPRPMEVLLLAWAVTYFLITGSFYVKFLRYLLPLFPVLYVFAAQMLYALHGWLRARMDEWHLRRGTPLWAKPMGYGGAGAILLSGFLYSFAFASIYSRPHSRIQATEWIRANLPVGSILTCEHWDDAVPLEVNCSEEQDTQGQFGVRQMTLYEPDNQGKYEQLQEIISQADYIVLSSNRLYGSIPKWLFRYPVTTLYYQLLFSEELGFRKLEEFTSYPSLLGFTLVDDWADESFTVYDHPKVLVFAKERNLGNAELDELFQDALSMLPLAQNEKAWRTDKTLLLDRPVNELPAVNDVGWNQLANDYHALAVLIWWAAIEILGLLALPITLMLCSRLADGGYILAKTLGWLLVGYLVWIAASLRLVEHTVAAYWGAMLLMGIFSGYLLVTRRGEIRLLLVNLRWIILGSEALFTIAYLGFVGLRILNPDLWQPWTGGEKSMEFAFLNAIAKSPYFPPYDPYFAHGYINYYYYGLYLVAGLIKLTGIAPSIAFNLAVPTLFAATVVNSFSLGYNLTRRIGIGLAAAGFVALLGNLDAAQQLVEGLASVLSGGGSFLGFDYWRSSRIIPFTINEFPYWSFLFADLHPHMIGIPFTILLLGLAYAWAQGQSSEYGQRQGFTSSRIDALSLAAVLALVLGAVAVTNLWDLPTYLFLLFGVFIIRQLAKSESRYRLRAGLTFLGIAALGLVLYLPFFTHYAALYAGLGLVAERTEAEDFMTIWGFFLLVIASNLFFEFRAHWNAYASRNRLLRLGIIIFVILAAALFIFGEWVLSLLVILVAMAGFLYWREANTRNRYAHLLIFLGLGILLGCEVVFLRDFLQGGEHQRMNTVFKFYIQAWVLLGIGVAAILPRLGEHLAKIRWRPLAGVLRGSFALLLFASSIFGVLGTGARLADRFPGDRPSLGTLDGLAYMSVGRYTWPDENHPIQLADDYQAIQWLIENLQGTPVVAEATVGYYREGGLRVASYTGLPTLLGMHQSEQRYDWQVGMRDGEARNFFQTTDVELAKDLISQLHIGYIYIGQLERIVYPEEGLAKFEAMRQQEFLKLVYENLHVRIYRVIGEA